MINALKNQKLKFKEMIFNISYFMKGFYQNINYMKHAKYAYYFNVKELNQFDKIVELEKNLTKNKNYLPFKNFVKNFLITHTDNIYQPNNLAFLIKNKNFRNHMIVEDCVKELNKVKYIKIDLLNFKKYEKNKIIIVNEFYEIFLNEIDNLIKNDEDYYINLFFEFLNCKWENDFIKMNLIEVLENFDLVQLKFDIKLNFEVKFDELFDLIDMEIKDLFNTFYKILLNYEYKETNTLCFFKLVGCIFLNHETKENLIYPNLFFNFLYEFLNFSSKLHPLAFDKNHIDKKDMVIHLINCDIHLLNDDFNFFGNFILNIINTNNLRNSIPVIINVEKDSFFINHKLETLLKVPTISITSFEFNNPNYLYLSDIIDPMDFLNKFYIFYINLFLDDLEGLKYFLNYIVKNKLKNFDIIKDFNKLSKFEKEYEQFKGKINNVLSSKNILTNYDINEKRFYLYLILKKFTLFRSLGNLYLGQSAFIHYLNDPFIITLIEEGILGLERNRSFIYLKKPIYKIYIINYLKELSKQMTFTQNIRLKLKYFSKKNKIFYFSDISDYLIKNEGKLERLDKKYKYLNYDTFDEKHEFDLALFQILDESNLKMMSLKDQSYNKVRDNVTNNR